MLTFAAVVLLVLLLCGAPILVAFALGGMVLMMFYSGLPLYNLGLFFFDSINNYVLLAIPLFILAGEFMVRSGMGKILVDFFQAFTFRIPGSLALVAIITSTFVSSLTGVIFAVLGSVGLVLFPAMIAAKYERGYSSGVLVSSSQLGILIPPSVGFIIYGFLTNTSVAQLFMAGIMPGLLLVTMLSATAIFIAHRKKYPLQPAVGSKRRKEVIIKVLPAIFMPVIVLGGIYSGIFSPTESGAVACLYCLVVGAFIYRTLDFKNIWASALETARIVGMIMVLLCAIMLFGRSCLLIGVPRIVGDWVIAAGVTPQQFILMLCVAFVALGFIMDVFAMIALLPVVMPVAVMLGIDPIHIGVLFVVASSVGSITPPAAAALYFAATLFNVPTMEILRGVLPFLITMIICLIVLAFFPEISVWLPGTMFR